VGEALKKNSQTLQKDTLLLFLSQLKTGLSEQELKELLSRYPQEVDFQTFMGQLEDVHRRAKTHQDKEEV
jgi:Ca2+-binding EF-hand superfamily protein